MVPAKVLKWGNSLALRLPARLAADAKLGEGSLVNVTLQDGRIVVESAEAIRLADLIEAITLESLHAEVATGKPRGKETW